MVTKTVVRKQVRRRGFFGWLFLIVFLAFNGFMALWAFAAFKAVGAADPQTPAEAAGRAIGAAIGGGILLWIWLFGAIILGLLALLTRGSRVETVEQVFDGPDTSKWSRKDRAAAEAQRRDPTF